MSLPENDIGEKINYIICNDDELDYERSKETQKGTSTQDLSQDKNQSVVIVGSIPPDYIYSSENEENGPKLQVSHNSDNDAIEDDYAMEEYESDSTDSADITTSCDSSEEGHSETNTNTTYDVCPEIRKTRYVCGDFDYVEDNYKNKKSGKSESRKWEPKKRNIR
ncbi:hypothetical protein QTN25_002881 [Entamoeba marina]